MPVRVGVEGLAASITGVEPGGIYIVLLPPGHNPLPLLINTLAHGIRAGSRISVCDVTAPPVAHALRQRLQADNIPDEIAACLSLFTYDATLLANPADNIWEFIRTFEQAQLQQRDCLCFMSADRLLPWRSRQALARHLRILGEWHAYHQVTGLYVVSGSDLLWNELLRQGQWLDGLARLKITGTQLFWEVPRWHGDRNETYPLSARHNGDLYSLGVHQEASAQTQEAIDEHHILACWNPAQLGQGLPINWQCFDSNDELLQTALQGATAATVILDYPDTAHYETLARQVHQLRLGCGRRLKIVVREAGGRIPYEQEMQLYHIGATRILRADQTLSKSFQVISALKGQWFWRPIEPDIDAWLASVHTSESRGYLPPADFTANAGEFLRCGLNTNVDCILVKLTLRSDQHYLAALNAFSPTKPGMFITTDDRSLYIFLFACPASDADTVLGQAFNQPIGNLFALYDIIVLQKEIEDALERIRYNTEHTGYTDYTDLLGTTD